MIIGILFWLLALLSCAYAVILGGRDGLWAASLIIAASVLTVPAAHLDHSWGQVETARMGVDAALLVGLYALTLHSQRYWPVWMTGFHLIAVTTHVSVMLVPHYTPTIYRAMQSVWALPVLLSMVIGIAADRQRALRGS
jgi:hypothetical protein